ncbi:MAG: hypothetical protein AB1345_13125, partial [Chloroflexota bacterium]
MLSRIHAFPLLSLALFLTACTALPSSVPAPTHTPTAIPTERAIPTSTPTIIPAVLPVLSNGISEDLPYPTSSEGFGAAGGDPEVLRLGI